MGQQKQTLLHHEKTDAMTIFVTWKKEFSASINSCTKENFVATYLHEAWPHEHFVEAMNKTGSIQLCAE